MKEKPAVKELPKEYKAVKPFLRTGLAFLLYLRGKVDVSNTYAKADFFIETLEIDLKHGVDDK